MKDDVAGLVERLDNLGKRREMEGIYTDQNICEAAASTIRALAREKAAAVGLAQGSGAIADQQRARAEAAEAKVTEQAAEIERLREAVVGWDRHAMEMQDLAGAAEAKLREAVEVIRRAQQFIRNGVDLGFIRMPDPETPDTAHETLPLIDVFLATIKTENTDGK